jgi:magnesium chelatase family protein
MVQRVSTVAFEGIEARSVDVQVQVAPGLPAFAMAFTINPSCVKLCGSIELRWTH